MQHPHPRAFLTDPKQIDTGRLRAAVRISEVAELGTKLRFAQGALRGRCPFHQEMTPGFIVDDSAGSYLCHGCGARGDALRLAQFLIKSSFLDTCDWLMANRAGANPARLPSISRAAKLRQAAVTSAKRSWRHARPLRGSPIDPMVQRMGFRSTKMGCMRFEWATRLGSDDEPGQTHPSLSIAFQDVDGSVVGVARYLLSDDFTCQIDGDPVRVGQFSGATARFGPARSRIILVPDIGDVPLTMRQYPGEAVWAVLQPQDLHDVALPHWVTHVTIFSTGEHIDPIARVAARVSLAPSCVTIDVDASC
ncbi:CHC2 zinc finger domain-containing protein [Sphingomonas sp. S2-65]|uniref:CHC2 zinc finger domain-containing protein n=1 Tax=Sphingomonas sp. S2-65 TaxID=2903960 RepID=UPI001F2CFE6B|nr:CHC2 zinc finger domain-containing protein [Sphingomonas sp. S2-65]UYY58021.1 CHC2 zinc finger domain-containing protein [Sphingomonas sp. S2-65]